MNLFNFKHEKIHQFGIIPTDEIAFEKEVREACKMNYCGRYGKTWTCPPYVGEIDELKLKVTKYKNAFVFTTVGELEDSFDIEGMEAARVESKKVFDEAIKFAQENLNDFMLLGCGSCTVCEKCTCPDSPCRFPEKAIPSIESCGINVVTLAKSLNINYYNGINTVTYFNMILF